MPPIMLILDGLEVYGPRPVPREENANPDSHGRAPREAESPGSRAGLPKAWSFPSTPAYRIRVIFPAGGEDGSCFAGCSGAEVRTFIEGGNGGRNFGRRLDAGKWPGFFASLRMTHR